MWSNYHTHTSYCDGKTDPDEVVSHARDLISLGFSSHAPLPFDCKWCLKPQRLDDYLNHIKRLKSASKKVEIYTGLEIDFIPEVISASPFRSKLDYTIGAVHFVESFSNGDPWEIDGPHNLFLAGLDEIFQHDIKDVVHRYYELIRLMVDTACPTIIAHLDKIKIQNTDNKFFSESDAWYRASVIETLDRIAQADAIVEVNTRGVYQKKSPTPYPSPWILELMREKKIPVTINSDAHHPDNLTTCFSATSQLLYNAGYREVKVLLAGKWQSKKFSPHGLIL